MAETIGTAYVQIEPSFDGVTAEIDKHFGGAGESGAKSFGGGFASVVGTVGKVAAGAVAAGATAVTALTKQAVSGFAEYQQLTGGVETLFKDSSDYVIRRAQNAFETAGLSANEYMETVTSFSASLLQSLGGDTQKAAEQADKAIIDMSDNANKMGTSMESIQNAYQGFAKQNYTMLDNLKLGYGGTKEEMKRLLDDAGKIAGVKFDLSSYSDIIEAIHVVQTEMGITGTTSEEAASTISGSMASVKAAWENVLTAMGTGDMTIMSESINDFIATAGTMAENMLPTIETALKGVSQLISELAPEIAAEIPNLITEVAPALLTAAVDIIKTLGEGIIQSIPDLMPVMTDVILELCKMLVDMAPDLIKVGLELIVQLALGIAQALPELIPTIVETVLTIAEYLIDNVDLLIDAAIALIMGLADGLIEALPILIEKAPEIIIKLVEALIRNAPKILEASTELIFKLIEGIVKLFGKIIEVGAKIVTQIKDGFSQKVQDAKNWGRDLIDNFINGIKEKWEHLKQTVGQVASSIKSYLGFSEPEEGPLSNFHTYAPDMMELYAKGIRENAGIVKGALFDATSDIMGSGLDIESVQSVQASVSPANIAQNDDRLNRIEALLSDFIENFKQDIYLDTGALVGGTVRAYNNALGQIAVQGASR